MKFILGRKIGMSQIHDEKGAVIPVTVLDVQPNFVTQVKTSGKDGYSSVQIATGKKKKISKALKGHFKTLGSFRFVREFRATQVADKDLAVGDTIDVSIFALGDIVKVTGQSKGKGFQGAVKRHGFHGMPASHGHYAVQRHIGSIGQRFPQHTLKGKKMAGRMGNERSAMRGLKVVTVDLQNNLLAVKGAVPGNRGSFLEIVTQ